MDSSIMNVAILGAGNIARSMATALAGITDEVKLYAVASRNLEKASKFAEEYGFEKAYGSYEELAGDENVDLIYIATPHSEHYNNAKLCLGYGRNCLVEKAFCGNRKQAAELIELARKKNILLAEAMWTRYMPFVEQVKTLLKNGAIGNVNYLEGDFSVPISHVERLCNPALAGGSLLDLGIYSLTIPALFFGTNIRSVKTECTRYSTGVDATQITYLTYSDNKMARVKSSFVDADSNYAKIAGDKGYIVFSPINVPEYLYIYDCEGNLKDKIKTEILVNGYEYEVLACKQALLANKIETEALPHKEILRMMGWMDSLRNHWGLVYPFENAEDIMISDEEAWGKTDIYDDVNPWDRSNTRSYLEVYDTVNGTTSTLATFDKVIEAPNWSHNGQFLTYNSEGRIYKFDLDTKKSVMVDSKAICKINNDHVLSADDTQIAVSDESQIDGQSRIYIIPLDGGEPVLVTQKAPSYLHGWDCNNHRMAYCAMRDGEYDVYTINEDGTDETRLTTAPELNDGCEYDSDGEFIYFNSVRSGLMQAYRMKADGTEQVAMTADRDWNVWFPHISPDKSKIVTIAYKKGDLWPKDHVPNKNVQIRLMNADGTDEKIVLELFGGQGTINVNSWSPDSLKFAYVRYEKMGL